MFSSTYQFQILLRLHSCARCFYHCTLGLHPAWTVFLHVTNPAWPMESSLRESDRSWLLPKAFSHGRSGTVTPSLPSFPLSLPLTRPLSGNFSPKRQPTTKATGCLPACLLGRPAAQATCLLPCRRVASAAGNSVNTKTTEDADEATRATVKLARFLSGTL